MKTGRYILRNKADGRPFGGFEDNLKVTNGGRDCSYSLEPIFDREPLVFDTKDEAKAVIKENRKILKLYIDNYHEAKED